jgi:hypothetical protein
MQVNSAQDWLTLKKRQVLAKSLNNTPAPLEQRHPSVYTQLVANNATIRQRLILPTVSGWGSVPGTASYINWCCSTSGAFATINVKDILSRQALKPLG